MKKCRLILILLLVLDNPLLIAINIYSQNQVTGGSQVIIEKVYLTTDRDYYFPGDDIWFKAYLFDASEMLLSDNSNNLHVELISHDQKIIYSRIVRLDEGLGNGDFKLNANMQPGSYKLRAYTNYMRNSGEQSFFFKDIAIINSSSQYPELYDSTKIVRDKFKIFFFPEGGSLVDNITCTVAFKAIDLTETGCDVWGEVYSSKGDLITTFSSGHRGMGKFPIQPLNGLSYYAIVKNSNGDIIKAEIPKSFPTGVTLNISFDRNNKHILTVNTNFKTLPLIIDKGLILTISARKTILKSLNFKLKSKVNTFTLPESDLPEGIVTLMLLDQDSVPLCERLIYIHNNQDISIRVDTDRSIFEPRDSVSVKISLSEAPGVWQEAYLSFSAVDKIYTRDSSNCSTTIASWFLLESDVRGKVEGPSYYFDPSNPDRLKHLDLLLCTQGWRDFEWKYQNTIYLPENGFKISGRVRRVLTDNPIKDALVNIGIFQNANNVISSVPVDSSGSFSLEILDLQGDARLIASAFGKRENLQGLLILDSMKYSPASITNETFGSVLYSTENLYNKKGLGELKQSYEIKSAISKKYTLKDTVLLNEIVIAATKRDDPQTIQVDRSRLIYGSPDTEILITPQMESYPDIRTVLIGRVAGLYITTPGSSSDSGIRIRGLGPLAGAPAFMLDGIVVPYDIIRGIPVNWIDRIDILKSVKASSLGMSGANGVISIITKTGMDTTNKPVLSSANIKISGYNVPRIFYSPSHSPAEASSYDPDTRSTLFWEPNIKIRNNESYFLYYFNSDNLSTIKIRVEGITNTGIPFAAIKEYEVK